MDSYFNLTLDTTPPVVSLYVIEFDNYIDIRVTANEYSNYQAKVIDNTLVEHQVSLTWDDIDKELVGTFNLANVKDGILRVDVVVYDDVNNSTLDYVSYLYRNDFDMEMDVLTMDNTIDYEYKVVNIDVYSG